MAAPMSPDDVGNESVFEQELELLQEIYIHEINIKRSNGHPCELSLVLHPATADRTDLQYVTLTLIFEITNEYPDTLPEIIIRNPRGLSEGKIVSLQNKLKECAESRLGEAMLFELIEIAKESLTANNTPSCECVICCDTFDGIDAFTKTQCYHYFHNDCLVRYLKYAKENEEQTVCPVCRELLEDFGNLSDVEEPTEVLPKFIVDPALREWQKEMSALKTKQAQKGGIIDVVANSNKFLLDISSTPTIPLVSVLTEPADRKVEGEKKDAEDSSTQNFQGYIEGKRDSGKSGRVRRAQNREHQHSSHSADHRRGKKTEPRNDGGGRAGVRGNDRGRYHKHRDQLEDSQRKVRPSRHATRGPERLASKSAAANSTRSGDGMIPQRKTSAGREAEKRKQEEDTVQSKDKDEDITSDCKIVNSDEIKGDTKIVEEEGNDVISATVQCEVASEELDEQKRTKQSGYCHEKEAVRNNARREHGRRGRGSNHGNPSRYSSGNIPSRNFKSPSLKKQFKGEEVRVKCQTKDLLSYEEGQMSKESQERAKENKIETKEKSSLNDSVEATDQEKNSESESGSEPKSKIVPPGLNGNSKVRPPPGFEEFR